jgi:hypothetical protein
VTIRICGYPPFGAQIILNGHEWVERTAQREGATVLNPSLSLFGLFPDLVGR